MNKKLDKINQREIKKPISTGSPMNSGKKYQERVNPHARRLGLIGNARNKINAFYIRYVQKGTQTGRKSSKRQEKSRQNMYKKIINHQVAEMKKDFKYNNPRNAY